MVPLIMLLCLTPTFVSAKFSYEVKYDVMPEEGPYEQEILVMIWCYPVTDTHQMYYSIFWDNYPVYIRQPSTPASKTTYSHIYDIHLYPPEDW